MLGHSLGPCYARRPQLELQLSGKRHENDLLDLAATLGIMPLAAQPSVPISPEQDIVAVVSASPLSDSTSVPGLLAGQRITDDLQSALELCNQIVLAAGPHRAEGRP